MHEILALLAEGTRVLDLGSGRGSFDATAFPLRVVRADLVAPAERSSGFVACSASRLPFVNGAFRAVILNHSLEHFEDLAGSVSEIDRVLTRDGYLYVAVPDASTFTDRVYRWLGRGGGHVNPFTDAVAVVRMFTEATGLRHAGTRVLCTSLSFLNRRNIPGRPPRKLLLFCNGNESFVRTLTYALRCFDRWFHHRASIYGWAFFFGDSLAPDVEVWSNVCVACGSGVASEMLEREGRVVRRRVLPDVYACPRCGTRNYFTDDDAFRHLR
jgi:Methyltransferase domain